jgi:hypothetical protein
MNFLVCPTFNGALPCSITNEDLLEQVNEFDAVIEEMVWQDAPKVSCFVNTKSEDVHKRLLSDLPVSLFETQEMPNADICQQGVHVLAIYVSSQRTASFLRGIGHKVTMYRKELERMAQ